MSLVQHYEYLLDQLIAILKQSEDYVGSHKNQFNQAEQYLKNQVTIQSFLYTQLDQQYSIEPSEDQEAWTKELIYLCQLSDFEITEATRVLNGKQTELVSAYALQDFIHVRIHKLTQEYQEYIRVSQEVLEDNSVESHLPTPVQETSVTVDSKHINSGDSSPMSTPMFELVQSIY
jgi:hypothetical protein